MSFNTSNIDASLPSYLSDIDKDRLKKGLEQFQVKDAKGKIVDWSAKNYTHFFLEKFNPFFLQGDLVREIRTAEWNYQKESYETIYPDVIVISSTCDIESETKSRTIDKQILFAPIIAYDEFIEDLGKEPELSSKIRNIEKGIKDQEYSNIFYLPPNPADKTAYIALMDQIFWFPAFEFSSYNKNIADRRIITLDYFGFYLFILKLSYHLCRLPEDQHRT